MQLYKYNVGPFAENTYLLINEKKSLVIDPGFNKTKEFEQMQETLREESAALFAVVAETHAHVDHILGSQLCARGI
ncbi:MAG: MBL fold metallo-hydrolase [Balneolaceae bacterium]|nr:MBL fold metallo-hydrolase [Balneolaceae bacterium]